MAQTRINFGCGQFPTPGWINVDNDARAKADVRHDLEVLPYPFESGSADDWLNGANAQQRAGRLEKAMEMYDQALALEQALKRLQPHVRLWMSVRRLAGR